MPAKPSNRKPTASKPEPAKALESIHDAIAALLAIEPDTRCYGGFGGDEAAHEAQKAAVAHYIELKALERAPRWALSVLLASGFAVPDGWLSADTSLRIARPWYRRDKGWMLDVGGVHDRDALARVCREIGAAILRLRHAPLAEAASKGQVDAVIGVSFRNVAEILQNGDLGASDMMLARWNKLRSPRPKPLGLDAGDVRVKLYAPTAICDWAEKNEPYLTVPKSLLVKRLTHLARPIQ